METEQIVVMAQFDGLAASLRAVVRHLCEDLSEP